MKQTELLKDIINPILLEIVGEYSNLSFRVNRNGRNIEISFLNNGKVRVEDLDLNYAYVLLGSDILIVGHCETIEDFKELMNKVDDIVRKIPIER